MLAGSMHTLPWLSATRQKTTQEVAVLDVTLYSQPQSHTNPQAARTRRILGAQNSLCPCGSVGAIPKGGTPWGWFQAGNQLLAPQQPAQPRGPAWPIHGLHNGKGGLVNLLATSARVTTEGWV